MEDSRYTPQKLGLTPGTEKGARAEQPSTYFVQDRSSQEELKRLQLQSQMLTTSMGGPLAEQENITRFKRILDVGCATGDWLIEIAQEHASTQELVGVDISKKMIDYAQEQAEKRDVAARVEFHLMDALLRLEFPDQSFDLVNQRFAQSFLRTWDWPSVLQEFRRVTRPGGVIRLVECDNVLSSSPTFAQLGVFTARAGHQAGYRFEMESNGVLNALPRILVQQGIRRVQTRAYDLQYKSGTPECEMFIEDMELFYKTGLPFLKKWTSVPPNYEEMYQTTMQELRDPSFEAHFHVICTWGIR